MDGIGSGNYAHVDDTNRLYVRTEGISVGSLSVSAGSQSHLFASGVAFHELISTLEDALITSVSGTIQTAGSIYSIPSISVTNPSVVEDGTESLGSSTLIGGINNGSLFPVRMDIGSYLMMVGSISSIPRIGISGTDDIGSVVISSAPLIGVSGAIFDSGDITGSFALKGIGSIVIKSASLIGVSGAIFDSGDITGSVVISDSTRLGISGIVEVSNQIQTAGSIYSIPPVSATAENVAEIGKQHLGSGGVVGGVSNGSMFPLIMTLGSFVLTAGSITSIPTTNVIGSIQVNTGSVRAQNVQITNPWIVLGSVQVNGGSIHIVNRVAGSIVNMPAVNATNESVAKDGTETLGSTTMIGGQNNGSVFPVRLDLGSFMLTAGSITSIPSINATNESVAKDGTETLGSTTQIGGIMNGSVFPARLDAGSWLMTAGSIVTLPPIVGVSGDYFQDMVGSVRTQNVQITNPWIILGSVQVDGGSVTIGRTVEISGGIFTGGDLTGSVSLQGIGSVIIKSSNLIGVSGLIFTDGNMTGSMVMKGVGSVIISSSNLIGVSGTIFDSGDITGSVNIATSLSSIGSYTGFGAKFPQTFTGSIVVSGGAPQVYIGSLIVPLNNEVNWISIIGSVGSTYNFQVTDSDGYQILSNLPRSGKLSYMTPFLASGNIVFTISGAQVSGAYLLRLGYT